MFTKVNMGKQKTKLIRISTKFKKELDNNKILDRESYDSVLKRLCKYGQK